MSKKVIVIGAGVAGLSAGCYASMNGYEVDVFEAHTIPGGLCTAWRVDGFLFDGCIEWLTGSGPASPFHQLWEEVGVIQAHTFIDREVYSVTTGTDGRSVALWADPDRLGQELRELSPQDAGVIGELCGLVREMRRARYRVDHADELLGFWGTLKMMRDGWPARKLWATCTSTTVRDFAQRFRDPLLRLAMASSLPEQLPLVALVMALADLANHAAGYPLGGSLPVAQTMAGRCASLGGRVHLRAPVKRVRVEAGRAVGVELASGQLVEADVVIAAGDLRATLDQLLEGAFPSPAHEELFATRELLPSLSYVSFGLSRPPVLDRRDAVTYRHALERPVTLAGHTIDVLRWKSYARDPSMAPPGKTVLISTVDSPHALWQQLKLEPQRYTRAKVELAEGLKALLEAPMPGFGGLVETVDVATPLTFERYTANHQGRFMTWLPRISARPPKPVPRRVPGVSGLYLAGMWVSPPGGLPNALKSGREAVELLCHAEGVPFRTERGPCASGSGASCSISGPRLTSGKRGAQ